MRRKSIVHFCGLPDMVDLEKSFRISKDNMQLRDHEL